MKQKQQQQIPLTEYEMDEMVDYANVFATNVIDILMNLNQIEKSN